MPVHVGQVTSEVRAATTGGTEGAAEPPVNEWDERARTAALLRRIARDERRTATGLGDD